MIWVIRGLGALSAITLLLLVIMGRFLYTQTVPPKAGAGPAEWPVIIPGAQQGEPDMHKE
jgi:hypothetical protein